LPRQNACASTGDLIHQRVEVFMVPHDLAGTIDDRREQRPDSEQFSIHRLADEAWLLDRYAQRAFHLNPTAALIWSAHLSGVDEADIESVLHRRFSVAPSTAARYVDRALGAISRAGRLRERRGRHGDTQPGPRVAMGTPRHAKRCGVLDIVVRLGFDSPDLYRRARQSLVGLASVAASVEAREWRVVAGPGDIALVERGRVIDRCVRADQLAPMIKARLVHEALESSRGGVALHAAALGAGARCILLPGRSGAGKSTLAAALASEGFAYLGDDTAVLTDGAPSVRPMPLPIALKAGSWPVLRDRFPRLLDLPVHWRGDGKAVRYLAPRVATRSAPRRPVPVGWVVFPAFAPGQAPALDAIGGDAALKRLLPGVAPLGAGLTPAKLDRLIAWIASVPCFELRYGALDDAIDLLRRHCR
jgi:hypothetical protein